jgi:hypothetical protein
MSTFSEENSITDEGYTIWMNMPFDTGEVIRKEDTLTIYNDYMFFPVQIKLTGFCNNTLTKIYLGVCNDKALCKNTPYIMSEYACETPVIINR